ncbi:MAG: mannose-6-phosphate isomerase [Verrucomicrobiota bacterium]
MSEFSLPLAFEPVFMERVWGGRKLESLYHKKIPPQKCIGESWEIVDRSEAQSIVRDGPLAGRSIHDLWVNFRREIFGEVPDAPRFPLLIKLLDCREKLSLQVHPPARVAGFLGGEPKTEAWIIVDAAPDAELWLGLREPTEPQKFAEALNSGQAAELVHRIRVKTGDAFLIPSGRMHAIGGGNLIVEVQENSDTTYRIFDWNRRDENGQARELHIEEAMRCIDFEDCSPAPSPGNTESLVADRLFAIERWKISSARELGSGNSFAIAFCLQGELECAGSRFQQGEFFLLPAQAENRTVKSCRPNSELLRITIPSS